MEQTVKVLCLMTSIRGGSKLFHSLIDSHPQILCFPRTLQFNQFWNKVSQVHGERVDSQCIIQFFIESYPRFFSGESWYRYNKYDRADQLGLGRCETFYVDSELFYQYALDELKGKNLSRRNVFIAFHYAYHRACGRTPSKNSIILYHIHDLVFEEDLKACLDDFSNVYCLVMVRHPIEGLNSCYQWMKNQNTLSCGELFYHYTQALVTTDHISQRFPDLDIRVLPYEQLNRDHRLMMKSLIEWIGVDWNESLMLSTMHGKLWWSNGEIPKNGPNPDHAMFQPGHWLEKNDWHFFCHLAGNRLKKWKYLNNDDHSALFLLGALPCYAEWQMLKLIFSIQYWSQILKRIQEEIMDKRLANYDFYSKTELPKFFKKNNLFLFWYQVSRHMYRLNMFCWVYYYIRRVIYYYGYLIRRKGDIPNLLLDVQ